VPDLTEVLLRLADPPLAPPDPLDGLERRVRSRRRRRRMARTAVAVTCAVAVGIPSFGILAGRDERTVQVETSETTAASPSTVPPTPARPSGRLLPTWLPGELRIQTAEERPATSDGGTGATRSYTRDSPSGDVDRLTLSYQVGRAPLDVETELARYAGARRMDVRGRPGMFLPIVQGRTEATVVWSPATGQLAQIRGVGLSDDELSGIAQGFVAFGLDATPLPEGFRGSIVRPTGSLPPPVPRRYELATTPIRGPASNPEVVVPAVRVAATWDDPLPPGVPETVRGRPAALSTNGPDTTLAWLERPGLLVTVTGTNLGLDDVWRVATGLREEGVEEVLSRPSGVPVIVARGTLDAGPYQLRVTGGAAGLCLELAYSSSVARTCTSDPAARVADLPISLGKDATFGAVVPEAARVRVELAGGRSVETDAVGAAAGQGAAFYAVVLPADIGQVVAVVALGGDGQVLRRTLVG
jgi:hypothetical protein